MMVQTLWLVLALGAQAQPAANRPVDVKFESGRIWMTARRATLTQILNAWSRAGKTRFEGVEKTPNPGPIDAQLAGVFEEEALAFLLKQAGGYTAIVRDIPTPAESTFARVVIIGSKSAAAPLVAPVPEPRPPPEPAEPPPPPDPGSVVQPALGPDGLPIPDDQQDAPPFRSMPPGFDQPPELSPSPSGPDGE